ncbi:LysR family transcriptional regulator [uncultured Aquabacterium sp.]|uniref:LysR family transcriptional regulator n=1 Tax=uncultured Aquabacterium sp. TaxID=158753 RepID=UPI002627F963|nr:LysR family transcriptional regulator [uncultured Aquabacterium sp.]
MNTLRLPRASLQQLRSFEAVARLGGIGKAAEALHLAQPTVSTQLKELAQALNLHLLEPEGRGVRLTPHGELLADTVRDLFTRWRRFEEDALAMQGLQKGRLKLAAVTTTEYFIPDLLGPFARQYPGLRIDLAVENRDAVIQHLARGDVELAVMMLPPTDLALERWPFLENPLVLIAPVGHPLAQRSRLRLSEVIKEARLTREPGSGTRQATDQYLAAQGVSWPARLALGSNEAIKHAVAAGLGLAILSRHTLGPDPASQGLVELKVTGLPIRRMWHVAWRSDRSLSLPARTFLAALRQQFSETPPGREVPRPEAG